MKLKPHAVDFRTMPPDPTEYMTEAEYALEYVRQERELERIVKKQRRDKALGRTSRVSPAALAQVEIPVVAHERVSETGRIEHVDAYLREIDVSNPSETISARAKRYLGTKGGFSIMRNGHEPHDGLMVALPNAEEKFPPPPLTKAVLASYMLRHGPELANPDTYFGGWKDSDTGTVYLDLSLRFTDLAEARTRAKEWKQLAIYDVAKGEEIRLARADADQVIYLPKDDPEAAWAELQKLLGNGDKADT